ncbi:hypothetical protein Mgra_00006038 [Meloidogyne graminicola]|uniref:Uncharacterized protein n=1 Tax=Meloidogyne graminicola TaxID=189291 RepID=A0A8S9ZMB3_9BILA|nr:hypothetical protein Mgra_00006038 [Meloidogyne graminicola]
MELLSDEMDETGGEWVINAGDFARKEIEAFRNNLMKKQQQQKKVELFKKKKKEEENKLNIKEEVEEQKQKQFLLKNEKKWIENLEAFGKWLTIVEKEVDLLEQQPLDIEFNKCQTLLVQLRDNCLEHFRLVSKLKSHNFNCEQQSKIAIDQCKRYQNLIEKFEKMQLPSTHLVPILKTLTTFESTDSSIEFRQRIASQLSLASTSSSIGFSSDLDSDLASVNSEVIVAEAINLINNSKEEVKEKEEEEENKLNYLNNIINKLNNNILKEENILIENIEKEIKLILISIDHLHSHYYSTPKPLEIAREDVKLIKLFASKVTEQKLQLYQLATFTKNEKLKQNLFKLVSTFKKRKEFTQTFPQKFNNRN